MENEIFLIFSCYFYLLNSLAFYYLSEIPGTVKALVEDCWLHDCYVTLESLSPQGKSRLINVFLDVLVALLVTTYHLCLTLKYLTSEELNVIVSDIFFVLIERMTLWVDLLKFEWFMVQLLRVSFDCYLCYATFVLKLLERRTAGRDESSADGWFLKILLFTLFVSLALFFGTTFYCKSHFDLFFIKITLSEVGNSL